MKRRTPYTPKASPFKKPRTAPRAAPKSVFSRSLSTFPQRSFGRSANFRATAPEVKCIDIASGIININPPATALVSLLNGVQTGAGFFNRVGARIEMKNLHIRGVLRNGATSIQDTCRLIVVYDRQPAGALPIFQDMFQTRDQTGTASVSGESEVNLDNRERFTIIRDKQFFLPSTTNAAGVLTNGPQYPGNDQESDINWFIPLKGLSTIYKSSSNPTTIADISTGALYLVACSVLTNANWQFNLGTRLRYNDL